MGRRRRAVGFYSKGRGRRRKVIPITARSGYVGRKPEPYLSLSPIAQRIEEGRRKSEKRYGHMTLRGAALATKSKEGFVNDVIRYNERRINELNKWGPKDKRGYPTQGWVETASQYWDSVREPRKPAEKKPEVVPTAPQAPIAAEFTRRFGTTGPPDKDEFPEVKQFSADHTVARVTHYPAKYGRHDAQFTIYIPPKSIPKLKEHPRFRVGGSYISGRLLHGVIKLLDTKHVKISAGDDVPILVEDGAGNKIVIAPMFVKETERGTVPTLSAIGCYVTRNPIKKPMGKPKAPKPETKPMKPQKIVKTSIWLRVDGTWGATDWFGDGTPKIRDATPAEIRSILQPKPESKKPTKAPVKPVPPTPVPRIKPKPKPVQIPPPPKAKVVKERVVSEGDWAVVVDGRIMGRHGSQEQAKISAGNLSQIVGGNVRVKKMGGG